MSDINGSKPTNFPLDESKLSFEIPRDEKPRENLLKLGSMITNRIGLKATADDPEYWGLASVMTDEMVEVALKMGVRKPKTTEQLMKLTKMEREPLEKLLTEMAWTGIIEYNWENLDGKNPNHEKRWILPLFVPGSAEFLNMRHSQIEEHPEVTAFFERMTFLPLEKITPMVPPGGSGIGMHVIPVEKAIETENEAIGLEKISYWLDKYEGKYAKSMCSCRASRQKLGEGCGDDPENWCIAVGDMATYVVETQRGEYITKEEALDIFRRAEENGFVHQITNIDGEQKIFGICNCNVNICNALRTSQLFNTPNMSRSAYVAKVETENCVACGRCVESCPAGAVKLGQKLCTQSGPITYPRQELPDDHEWGPEKWAVDYRDKNRVNCYETGTAPCKTACPAHIAVQGYLKLAAQGKYREALQLIKRDNPFPAVCGRICNRRCEDACTRGTIDQAVAIDEVKRFIAQQDLKAETRFVPEKVIPKVDGEFEEKIAIIGGGPAGLSCAYYLAEKGYRPTVFEKEKQPGGMLMHGIPEFRLEKDVIEAEIDVLRALGVEFRCGVEVGKDVTIPELREQGYKGFYVAIGLQSGGKLGVPGEDAEGVKAGIELMREVNLEGKKSLSGRVVVIGGGNIGADVARTALRCGAEKVSLYCLEDYDSMPMGEEDRTECEEDGIEIHAGWGQTEILSENGKCSGIRFRKCLSVRNAEGRFAPTFDDDTTEEVPCEMVLYCIGQKVDWKNLLTGTAVELNPNGTAKADPVTYQTAEPDLFVGGDAYTGQKFAIDAIAAGKQGAVSLHRWVQQATLTIGRDKREFIELDKKNLLLEETNYDNTPRQRIGYNETLRKTFKDGRIAFTEEQVKAETARCLGCGASVVDPNKCIGCGICTTRCAFDAIHLHRDLPECSTMRSAEDKMKGILPYMIKRKMRIRRTKKAEKRNG
ncbi:MAG TPA: pyridine nucleotide-disulfide oxidoreductase [Ruminococcaceae bacterium]|nr:pyridine nucleotide-disulfide oxidoreductase [Oscillospiraceae bacterium]